MSVTFPCPCCGHLVFEAPPGSDDICMICFWEDDADQLRFPHLADATNVVSLAEAQQNYLRVGAIDPQFAEDVRKATAEDERDAEFRPLQESDSFEETASDGPAPEDTTQLYYWRATFWRHTP